MNPFNSISEDGTELKFKKFTENATTPVRGSRYAAGFDLFSAEFKEILPQSCAIVNTDIGVMLPRGTYGRVAPRSGLAVKNFIDVGAGVVDFDYRGNVGVVLFNHHTNSFHVKKGDKIAQLIIEKICVPKLIEVNELDETERGTNGFGSTEQKEEQMDLDLRDNEHLLDLDQQDNEHLLDFKTFNMI